MGSINNDRGKQGEDTAYRYLEERGYVILDYNWRWHHLELDIVARTHDTLVIVEVKTRSANHIERPEETLNETKMRRIVKAAQAYVYENEIDLPVRFDLIFVTANQGFEVAEHFIDAFDPPTN